MFASKQEGPPERASSSECVYWRSTSSSLDEPLRNLFVKLCPPALKEIDPSIVLPLPVFGVLNRQEAIPLDDFEPPLIFVFPIVAAHATPVGLTGDPPLVTRTEATTSSPPSASPGRL